MPYGAEGLREGRAMKTKKFAKVGSAYVMDIPEGRFWIRRNHGRAELVWETKNAMGERVWHQMGTFRTIADAMSDAYALDAK